MVVVVVGIVVVLRVVVVVLGVVVVVDVVVVVLGVVVVVLEVVSTGVVFFNMSKSVTGPLVTAVVMVETSATVCVVDENGSSGRGTILLVFCTIFPMLPVNTSPSFTVFSAESDDSCVDPPNGTSLLSTSTRPPLPTPVISGTVFSETLGVAGAVVYLGSLVDGSSTPFSTLSVELAVAGGLQRYTKSGALGRATRTSSRLLSIMPSSTDAGVVVELTTLVVRIGCFTLADAKLNTLSDFTLASN